MWTPRKGSILQLWVVNPKTKDARFSDTGKKKVRGILSECGIKATNRFSARAKWPARKLIEASDGLDRRLAAAGYAAWWFVNEPRAAPNGRSWYEIGCAGAEPASASQMRSGVHFGFVSIDTEEGEHPATVVSQRFVETVKAHKLRGLEFLPVPPHGKRRQDGWWEAFAARPLGRGLDHSALDFGRVDRSWAKRYALDPQCRDGVVHTLFEPGVIDPNRVGHAWLASRAKLGRLAIRSPRTYVLEEIPKGVDFAYTVLYFYEGDKPRKIPYRDIVCSHKAKKILVAAGMLRPTLLEVIEVIPAAEADQPILDRTVKHPLPRAMLRPDDVEKERARRQALIDALPVPVARRPGRKLTLRQAAERLRALWEKPWGRWGKSGPVGTTTAEAKQIAKSAKVPKAWKEIAPLLPLIVEDPESTDMDLWRADKPEVSGWVSEDAEKGDDAETPTKKDIEIGSTITGDWYSIRLTDKAMPKDAKVRLWDHETGSIQQEWDNVAAFTQYLMEIMQAVGKKPASD